MSGWDPGADPDLDETDEPVEDQDETGRRYETVDAWLTDWLLRIVRPRRTVKWCSTWWQHSEARSRLTALWLAWETHWGDDDGRSHWWIVHFPPHWEALTSADGLFAGCDGGDSCKGDRPRLESAPLPELNHQHGAPSPKHN